MCTQDELSDIIQNGIDHIKYPDLAPRLYDPVRYTMESGGKRLRPLLVLMATNLFKEDITPAIQPALGIEMYHNFTLLHDDVMDKAPERRGRATVHVKWDDNTAILSGDAMQALAYQLIAETPAYCLKEVIDVFNTTNIEIDEGQQLDMDFENRTDVTEEEYIEMIRLKTSVLLACAVKIGAILADATPEDADTLYKFAEQLGLAFQLQDDFLDVYGDTKVFGKAIGGDITSNKKTYMLINACNRANAAQQAELLNWIGLKDFDAHEKIAAVTRLYNEIGIDRLALQKIEEYFAESRKYLDKLNVPEERKSELRKYVANMMNRQN